MKNLLYQIDSETPFGIDAVAGRDENYQADDERARKGGLAARRSLCATSMAETISDMQDSMVVNMAYHANDPSVGLTLHRDSERYKMFVCDTGLFVTLAFWDKKFTDNIIYEKLLSDKLSADLGYVYENMVAQMLKTSSSLCRAAISQTSLT